MFNFVLWQVEEAIYLDDETTAFLVFINNIKDNSKSTFAEGGKGTV